MSQYFFCFIRERSVHKIGTTINPIELFFINSVGKPVSRYINYFSTIQLYPIRYSELRKMQWLATANLNRLGKYIHIISLVLHILIVARTLVKYAIILYMLIKCIRLSCLLLKTDLSFLVSKFVK